MLNASKNVMSLVVLVDELKKASVASWRSVSNSERELLFVGTVLFRVSGIFRTWSMIAMVRFSNVVTFRTVVSLSWFSTWV